MVILRSGTDTATMPENDPHTNHDGEESTVPPPNADSGDTTFTLQTALADTLRMLTDQQRTLSKDREAEVLRQDELFHRLLSHQEQKENRPSFKPSLPNDTLFSGAPGESFQNFWSKLLLFFQIHEIVSPTTQAHYLGTALKDRAWTFYSSLTKDVQTNFDSLKSTLQSKYEGPDHRRAMRDAVRSRTQGPDEDVSSYTKDITYLIAGLHPSDDQAVEWYLQGLKPEIRLWVDGHMPSTISAAETLARKREQLLSEEAKLTSVKTPELSAVQHQPHQSEEPTDRITSLLDKMWTHMSQHTSNTRNSQDAPPQRRSGSRPSSQNRK